MSCREPNTSPGLDADGRAQWVDEDEQDDAPEDDYMNSFGGFGDDSLGGIDFSKMGGGAGADSGAGGDTDTSVCA